MKASSDRQFLHVDRPTAKEAILKHPASTENIQAAKDLIRSSLSRLAGSDWLIEIDLGDGHSFIIDSSCPQLLDPTSKRRSPDCFLTLPPFTVFQMLTRGLDPRYAMLYSMMDVAGSARAATLFLDALAGRKILSKMSETDLELPSPTTDLTLATEQLHKFGYCIVKDALSSAQVKALKDRVVAQARAERELGRAWLDGNPNMAVPPNQRVWNLFNKGKVFLDLLEHPLVDHFCLPFLGEHYLLSSYQCNIAGPGGQPMFLHNDQISTQPPIPDVAIGLNILWFLDDVTEENGGTRVLPGSHLGNVAPDNVFSTEGTVAAQGPAGCAMVLESRLWHGTGANVTADQYRHVIISYFVRSWLRTVENCTLSVRPEVLETLSDRMKTLLGFRCTGSLGGIDGPVEGQIVSQRPDVIGELGS
jgi:ectoine hydroxylase-related dioxygenase (phytanoyl-CoA dioxygenase family)